MLGGGDVPAIPANINLARQKPQAVAAYTRRVKSIATNAQTFPENSYVNITLDTSTPGAFNDNHASYLKFDLNITNPNPYADYVSFGTAGAASVIEEFRIYVQGTPIEEILQYNVMFQLMMDVNAQCRSPYYMFRPSKISQNVKKSQSVNAIKAPMVNRAGNPMHYNAVLSNLTGTGGSTYETCYGWSNLLSTDAPGMTPITYMGYGDDVQCRWGLHPSFLQMGTTGGTDNTGGGALVTAPTVLPAAGTNITNLLTVPASEAIITKAANPTTDNNLTVVNLNIVNDYSTGGYISYASLPTAGMAPATTLFGTTSYFFKNPDYEPQNPLNWPFIMPNDTSQSEYLEGGVTNIQDYFMFLSNVKLIPIGVKGRDRVINSTDSGKIKSLNFSNVSELTSFNTTCKITCCIPLISGFLGSLTEKMSPFMLMAPGSTYIQLRTAAAVKALQVSMDPCRRVLGTLRDYVPFMGSIGGTHGQFTYLNPVSAYATSVNGTTTTAQTYAAMINNYVAGIEYFTNAAANVLPWAGTPVAANTVIGPKTQGVVDGQYGSANNARLSTYGNYPLGGCFACIGGNLRPLQAYLNEIPAITAEANRVYYLMFCPYSVAAMEGSWTTLHNTEETITMPFYAGATVGYQDVQLPLAQTNYSGVNAGNFQYASAGALGQQATPFYESIYIPVQGLNMPFNPYLVSGISAVVPDNTLIAINAPSSQVIVGPGTANQMIPFNATAAGASTTTGQFPVNMARSSRWLMGPAGIPLPQYMLVTTPWSLKYLAADAYGAPQTNANMRYNVYGAQILPTSLASETYACFGTYLEQSRHQSMRVFSGNTSVNGGTYGYVQYYLTNVEFVGQQVILPDAVASRILASAQESDISIESNSIRTYQSQVQTGASTQNILIPAKVASANTMFCVFQPANYSSGGYDTQLYESTSRLCPYSTIWSNSAINTSQTATQTTLGQTLPFTVVNAPTYSGAFEVQLKIGNELIPQQPLTCISEIVAENVKAQHKLFDVDSNFNATFSLTTSSGYSGSSYTSGSAYTNSDTTNGFWYDCLKDNDFCAAFTFAPFLDDQTYIGNPNWNYIAACASQAAIGLNSSAQGGTANTSQYTTASMYGTRSGYTLPLFTPLSSTFYLGFDMDTWARQSSVARSGKYLGNNQITLYMTNCSAFNSNNTGLTGINLYTFVLHDVRYSFQAGGSVVAYY